jgi:hypothetical protein
MFSSDPTPHAIASTLYSAGFTALECLDPEGDWYASYPANGADDCHGVWTIIKAENDIEWGVVDGSTGLIDDEFNPTTLARAIDEAKRRNA